LVDSIEPVDDFKRTGGVAFGSLLRDPEPDIAIEWLLLSVPGKILWGCWGSELRRGLSTNYRNEVGISSNIRCDISPQLDAKKRVKNSMRTTDTFR